MMQWCGYAGKILNVDLSKNKINTTPLELEFVKTFVGGFGINCRLGADLLKPKTKPLSSENIIIVGAGPLVGTITPGSSRIVGFSKFPATGAIANSCGSMSFGFNLKQAGYDHIIIKGKAEEPLYLTISNEEVELRPANKIWGKDIVQTTDYLWKEYKNSGVMAIGQAGENLVKSSMTLIDKTSTFGRAGLAAIMGFKNLKAIVAKGTLGVPVARPKEFKQLYKKIIDRVRTYAHCKSWIELGMLRSLPIGMILAAKGQKKKARQCSERTYLKKIKKRRLACPSCPMADKDVLEIKEGDFKGLVNYTSSVINPFLMLTLDGLNSYNEAIKAFDMISRYGLDSLTITALLDFLAKMNEEGFLTQKKIGYDFKRDYESLKKLIELIANREEFGDLLADGWKEFSEAYKDLSDKMLTVKGLDVVFEPRFLRLGTMEFEQVVNPKGAHVASGGSPTYVGAGSSMEKFKMHFRRMGVPDSAMPRLFEPPLEEMGINVGRLTRYSEDWYTVLTSTGLCARAQMNRFYGLESVTKFYNAVTGFDLTTDEIRTAAERSWNLLKLINAKEGFSRKDDKFPKEWFKPLKYGENKLEFQDFYGGIKITKGIANQLLDDYYDERGWNKDDGLPSNEKLEDLGLRQFV
ncbi:MAG: hypothetical protein GF383_11470 [Candidatus Lokiarchaeota archaeon]|nr:hypothetical protein [Candidatus Lokiarchaeota archaeon]MBD3341343.1 hypothetical protein [Candidatus Lokiarchaeota archaeon]